MPWNYRSDPRGHPQRAGTVRRSSRPDARRPRHGTCPDAVSVGFAGLSPAPAEVPSTIPANEPAGDTPLHPLCLTHSPLTVHPCTIAAQPPAAPRSPKKDADTALHAYRKDTFLGYFRFSSTVPVRVL